MSAFMCLEKQYQKEVVSDLVVNSYTNSLEKALRVSVPSGGSLSAWDREWHIYMTKKEYLHHE